MLNRLLPPNTALRRKLSFASKRWNFGVTKALRDNFSHLTVEMENELREILRKNYMGDLSKIANDNGSLPAEIYDNKMQEQLIRRLERNRYQHVPWINSVIKLRGAHILEIGSGTGASTVSLAEQHAQVTGLDIDPAALRVAEERCRIHGLANTRFVTGNATEIGTLFEGEQFDIVMFYASLEHMTMEERKNALRAAWSLLSDNKYLCIARAPNRLWFYDSHTSHMPFFNWLPDELAFEYSRFSPRPHFNKQFREKSNDASLRFIREGRGVSFHELDVSLSDEKYEVVSDMETYLSKHNPARLARRLLAGDGRRERLLRSYAPERHQGFFKENLDILLRKV